MDAKDWQYVLNLPVDFEDISKINLVHTKEKPSEEAIVASIVSALSVVQKTLLSHKRNGEIRPEITRRSQTFQVYNPLGPGQEETRLTWPPSIEEDWSGIIRSYIQWVSSTEEFGRIVGYILSLRRSLEENAAYGLLRLLSEHCEVVLKTNQLYSKPVLLTKSRNFLKNAIAATKWGCIRLQISNIYPPEDPVKWQIMGTKVVLRRLLQSDLEGRGAFRELNPGLFMPQALCFIEGTANHGELRDLGKMIMISLRLFAGADPDIIRDEFFTHDFCDLMRRSVGWHKRRPINIHPHILDFETAREFIKFTKAIHAISGIELLLKQEFIFESGKMHRKDPTHWLQIALARYEDATCISESLERRVASSIMSLEGVVSKSDEKGEILHRVSIRCALLADLFNFNSKEIRRTVARAYEIRSRFVHGGQISSKELSKLERDYGAPNAFERQILTINRLLLLVAVFSKLDKEELVGLVDEAMISPKSRGILSNRVQPVRRHLKSISL